MNWRSLINFNEHHKQIAGVNIKINSDQSFVISCVIIKIVGKKAVIVDEQSDIRSFDDLIQFLNKKIGLSSRIHVNVEGRGILWRELRNDDRLLEPQVLLTKLFPSLQQSDILYQIVVGEDVDFIFIARTSAVLPFIQQLKDFMVTSLSLGVGSLVNIPWMSHNGLFVTDSYKIQLRNQGKIETILALTTEQTFDSQQRIDQVPNPATILAHASAFTILNSQEGYHPVCQEAVESNKSNYSFNLVLYRTARIILVSTLAILLTSNALSLYFDKTNEALKEKENALRNISVRSTSESNLFKELTIFRDQIGWDSNLDPLYIADQLALAIVEGTSLTFLEVGVLNESEYKINKILRYRSENILVKGLATDVTGFTNFVSTVDKLPWVEKIYDQNFQFDSRINSGKFHFCIVVKYPVWGSVQ